MSTPTDRPRQLKLRKPKTVESVNEAAAIDVEQLRKTKKPKKTEKAKHVKPQQDDATTDATTDAPAEAPVVAAEAGEAEEPKTKRPLMGGEIETSNVKDRGIVYISHLPTGFAEPQLRRFLGQFGEIKRLRLIRSKKTAGSKGYAFIEFEFKEVAEIVAQTMNGYMMFGKVMKCRVVTRQDIPAGLFTNYIKYPKRGFGVDQARKRHVRSDADLTEEQANKLLEREAARNKKLQAAGIDFTPPSIVRSSR